MKNKTLYILLLIPFVIAILGFVNIVILENTIAVDIISINWDYRENEGFKIRNEGYLLEATPVIDDEFTLSEGNDLVWSIRNQDSSSLVYAEVKQKEDDYYLYALNEGDIIVTCSNEKGTVSKSFNAKIYEDWAIIINPRNFAPTNSMISSSRKYGLYNLVEHDASNKVKASLELDIQVYPEDNLQEVEVISLSDNISYSNGTIDFVFGGEATISLAASSNNFITTTYSFDIVDNGVNVYDYNDLLACTNQSLEGEIVCLQINLESLNNTYQKDDNGNYSDSYLNEDTRLFGNYDFSTKSFNFKNEVYYFETTYNHEYIKQYFEDDYLAYSQVISAIHVQKDFYGNGFTINIHELAYPKNGTIDSYSGKLKPNKELDMFQGPLTFVSLGLFEEPFVKAYGQDNINMYVEGDNITIDDVKLRNTNNLDNLFNLEYTGSVIDFYGSNNTLKNSLISNGRTGVRVFSSNNFTMDNCLVSTCREFLFKIGNNEYQKIDPNKIGTVTYQGESMSFDADTFLNSTEGYNADLLFTGIFDGSVNVTQSLLDDVQYFLDSEVSEDIYTNATIKDCYFYQSGIFSIAFDTYFAGLYLYNGYPTFVRELLSTLMDDAVLPDDISGTQIPVHLTIEGDTRFYDYKDVDSIDASCLIEERLGELLGSFGDGGKISLENYFPIVSLLKSQASQNGLVYNDEGTSYVNSSIAFYGGGLNQSTVDYSSITTEAISDSLNVDVAYACLTGQGLVPSDNQYAKHLAKCIPIAMGLHDFKFYLNDDTFYLFNETPDLNDLIIRGQ